MIPDPKTETTEGAGRLDVEAMRERLLATFGGGYKTPETIEAFRHGMETVCNVLASHQVGGHTNGVLPTLSRPQATPDPRIAEIWQILMRHDAADQTLKSVQELASKCPDYYAIVTDAVMAERAIEDNAVQIVRDLLTALSAIQQRVEQVTAERDAWRTRFGLQTSSGWQTADAAFDLHQQTWRSSGKALRERAEAAEATIARLTQERAIEQQAASEAVGREQRGRLEAEATIASLTSALKLVELHFKRNHNSGNFQGDDEHEAWTAVSKALASLPSSPVSRPAETEK